MKIFDTVIIGADSAGYALKEQIKEKLVADGYNVVDKGTDSDASCHYPIYGGAVAEGVQGADEKTCGILVCGTGIGMSMVANKYKGIRAALCSDVYSAKMTKQHNNANIICMGGRVIGRELAFMIVDAWLETEFEGGRHANRIAKIHEIEK